MKAIFGALILLSAIGLVVGIMWGVLTLYDSIPMYQFVMAVSGCLLLSTVFIGILAVDT
jgi:uncharacterized membrane protein